MTKIAKLAAVAVIAVVVGNNAAQAQAKKEKKAVIAVIKQMFDGMRKGDADMVAGVFYDKDAKMQTCFTSSKTQKPVLRSGTVEGFVTSIKNKKPDALYDEQISEYIVKIDDNMANVWTPYKFYLNKKFSHCGVNNFQLFKSEKGWKIISIFDTRRRKGCE